MLLWPESFVASAKSSGFPALGVWRFQDHHAAGLHDTLPFGQCLVNVFYMLDHVPIGDNIESVVVKRKLVVGDCVAIESDSSASFYRTAADVDARCSPAKSLRGSKCRPDGATDVQQFGAFLFYVFRVEARRIMAVTILDARRERYFAW